MNAPADTPPATVDQDQLTRAQKALLAQPAQLCVQLHHNSAGAGIEAPRRLPLWPATCPQRSRRVTTEHLMVL
jgi:hypothetical protein